MIQSFTCRAALRYFATVAFSIFSYAVMAQSAPSVDACGHVLSSFQERLYTHFLAGPDSLREFVFIERGVHPLGVREADAWARNIRAQVCPAGAPMGAGVEDEQIAPLPRALSSTPAAMPSAVAAASPDGCTTNVLDVMHCAPTSERTREAVIADLRNAQAAGEAVKVGELSDAEPGSVIASRGAVASTRMAVRRELALARAEHQLAFGER